MSTAAILAGGRASRLDGRRKSALRIGDRSIAARQLIALGPVVEHVLTVTGSEARAIIPGVRAVADLQPRAGPLGGIYTALLTAPTAQTLIVACDMPFLSAPFLRYLLAAGRDADVAVPRTAEGYHPLCASYSAACVTPIRRRLERAAFKVVDLFTEVRVREVGPEEIAPFDPDGSLLFNINTPGDYERACHLAARSPR